MNDPVVSIIDVANQLVAAFEKNDKYYDSIINRIEDDTECLADPDVKATDKYSALVGVEYLLIKIRMKASFEILKVKKQINDITTPANIKSLMMKRNQTLSELLVKLSDIRDDVAVLQRVVYAEQTRGMYR